MKTIQILEDDDIVVPSDWCRPLQIISMSGGHSDYYSFESCYTGLPENNVKWCRVEQIFGSCWFGKPVKEINISGLLYEFARGDIPWKHQYGKTKPELREEYKQYLKTTRMKCGKYKGKYSDWIEQNDQSYFSWAQDSGLIHNERDYTRE